MFKLKHVPIHSNGKKMSNGTSFYLILEGKAEVGTYVPATGSVRLKGKLFRVSSPEDLKLKLGLKEVPDLEPCEK